MHMRDWLVDEHITVKETLAVHLAISRGGPQIKAGLRVYTDSVVAMSAF